MQNNAMMAVDAAAESPLPEIDPARVVMDLPAIDPARVVMDKPAADPRRKKLVRKMFQEGDPFAIFEPTERKRLSELNLDVRDQKQIMLAAFFADGDGKRFDWAYSNLRGLTDQIFGKDFDTDRAFAEVCKIYEKPADQGFVMKTDGSKAGEVGHALKSGIGRIGADVLKTVKMAAEKPNALALIADLLIPNNAWQQMRERAVAMTPLNDWIDTYDKYTEYESAAANMKGDWFSNSDSVGDWVFQALKGIVAEAPSMAVQFGAWAVSPGTGIAVTAGSSAAGKHYDLQSEEIDPRLKLLNALLTGTVNGALERITGGIIRGKGAEKVVKEGLKKGYKKALLYFGKNMLKEGAQEFSEQLAENTVDMFTGVGGGTLGERARHLLRGTGESAVIGMFYGGAGSVPGYVSALDVERRNELIRRTAEQEIERIKGIANASDEQIRQMKELQTLLESDDLGKAVDLIVTNRMKEDAARKREQEIEDADTPELGYEIADGMDKETVLKAKEAEEWLAIRNTLRHNPQDTEDAVAEASVFYRDTAFHIVHGRGDYPADVQAEMERIGKNPDQIRAFTYDGNVYVNADRVRPSEVPALLLHEVVGHKGLRAVFGKDFDLLLDSVVKEHLNDQDFRRIAEQYQCDLETVDGARYAAEEYLARYAEQHGAGIKPKWWKEMLQRIRVFLSKHHLYRNVRFTDAEIEVALARSIRHTRKQWNNKTIEQGSKKEEDGEDSERARGRDVRFAVNEKFNEELEKQRNGTLEAGHIYQLGMPPQVLLDTGVPDLPIELSASRLAEKAGTAHHPFGIEEVRSLPLALEHPIGVFAYGNKEKAQNIVVELQKDGKHFIVGLSLKFEHDGLIVNSIRGLYPKDTHEWLNWIQQGKALYLDKEKIQSMIAQQRRNPADVSYLDLDSLEKIVQDFRNVKDGKDKKEERISNREQGSKKEEDGKGDVRFSIEEYSAEEQERIIDLMRPFVGKYADKEDSEYADFLAKRGIAASEQDARYFASQAAKDNLSAARKREKEVENQWHYEHNFWIRHLTDFTGTSDFKIRPSFRFQNEDFSGTFISEPWRNKGKKFTPKNARDAERHRRKLETADGYASDELAKAIARKTGGDELEIEQQLIDYFRNLTKPDLHKQYKAFKDSETFGDRVAEREMREAWEAREENRISMELEDILTNGRQITEEYLAKEPEVVKRLAQQLLGNGERKYYKVYKNDLEAINAALRQEEGDASGYAQGYRAGRKESAKEFREKLKADREKAWQHYREQFAELRRKMLDDRSDTQKLQKEAAEFARKNVPKEYRGEFMEQIARLASYSNLPTKAYPEGKRKAMFDELLDNMRLIGSEARKKIELERLHDRMDELVPRRSNGKTVGSRSEESQKELKLIRDIVDASDNANAARLAELAQKMDEADRNGQELSDEELLEYAYLQNFSNLEEKSPEHLKSCIRAIDSIARKGRSDFRAQIAEVMHQVARERDQFIQAVSGGKGVMSPQKADLQQAKRRKYAALMSAGEFARQNMNLEFLLSHITMNEGVEFEKSHFYEYIRRVHRCRQEYKKRLTARNQDFEREFDRIFGTNGVISRGSELKRLREKSEHTGIMRHQRENPRDGIKFEWVPYAEAKQLLREYDYGERRGSLLAHEAEAIRQQISDYVQKAEKKTYPEVGDAATDEVMKFIRKDAREGMICIPRVVDPGRLVEQPFSQMEALDMWLMSRQADVAMKMRFNGWTDESMKQLEVFLEPKVKEFGLFLQKEIAENFEALNRVYKKMYYAEMNHNPDYWMTSYSNLKRSEENTAADMGNAFKVYGVAPGMLKDRQFHLLEPKAEDAIAKWSNNAIQSEHFITHAGEVRNWRRLLNNKSVQDAITQYVGDDAYMALVEKVQIFADGGRRDIEKCRFAGLFGNWARTNVLLNIGSGLKQTAGGLAYMNDIPAGAFVKYQAAFFRHPVANAKMLMNTPYFKMRFASSGDRDLAMLMNWAASLSGKSAAYARQLTEYGSLPMRLGDAVAVLSGGWAVYKYHYDNLIKSGEMHKAAHEEALLRWEMSTERTQQSSEPHNMNRFQLGGPVTRALTTYLSNPILTMQREFDTITALAKGRGGRKKHVFNLTKQIFVNHVIIPFLMELIGNFLRHRENWEEYEWARTASAMLAGPFCGVFVLGDVLETVFNTLFSRGGMMFSGGPGRDFELAARRTRKLFDEDVSGDDVYKAIESWGKAASVLPYIGIGTAVMRELRRMKEFFMPEEK